MNEIFFHRETILNIYQISGKINKQIFWKIFKRTNFQQFQIGRVFKNGLTAERKTDTATVIYPKR